MIKLISIITAILTTAASRRRGGYDDTTTSEVTDFLDPAHPFYNKARHHGSSKCGMSHNKSEDTIPTVIPPEPTVQKVKETGCKGLGGKRIYLVGINGKRLARCQGCGPGAYSDSAAVHGNQGDNYAIWSLEDHGDKCAMKADTGKYLSRCNGCWRGAKHPDSAFIHVAKSGDPWSSWTMEKHGDKYAFKSDIGKYLAVCSNCVPGGAKPEFAFVNENQPLGPALWKVEVI